VTLPRVATRTHVHFAGFLLAVATLFSAPARADDWGTPGLDAMHGRLTAERSGSLFASGRWTASFAGGTRVLASPMVADGFVVTADLDGVVRALRAEDGTLVWQAAAGSSVQGTPAVIKGRVYVPALGNRLMALRLSDGAALWTRDVDGMVLSSPTGVNDDVVVAVGFPERHVERRSGATGELVWRSPPVMAQFSNTSPAVGGGVVVVGSNGGMYYAFDEATGRLRWEYAAGGIVHLAAPLIAGGRVYMAGGGDSGRVHAVDLTTGKAASGWPVELPAPDADITGARIGRQRAVSSFASVGGLVVIQTRLDDAMDTNADGTVDKYLSREMVVGLNAATGAVAWQHALSRAENVDTNDVPKFFVCPTPAAYGTDGGALLAVASSLKAVVAVLDATSGAERARHVTAGAALASPVVANGRLLTTAMNGTTQALGSSVNHAPTAPILASSARPLDAADVTLRWLPATDPDGELASYELRIDADGELLESWQQQILLRTGEVSVRITTPLADGVRYTFAVRARDARGALSSWSQAASFTVATNPPVTIGGTPAGSLAGAVGAAQPGDVIGLGAGTYRLTDTLRVPAGVSIRGAGAGATTLDATGLAVGVSFDAAGAGKRTGIDRLTVTGADTCVAVNDGATGVSVTHAIVRDCKTNGVAVKATGEVDIVNATLVGNGTAVSAAGGTTIKNSLVTGNGVGLARIGGDNDALVSSYNDVFGNPSDYTGTQPGTGDLSVAVTFADLAARNLRLGGAQPSTDRGDPADAVGDEPAPHGGRINLGAFGGTADAEITAQSTAAGGGGSPTTTPVADPISGGQQPGGTDPGPDEQGCSVGARPVSPDATGIVVVTFLAGAFIRRRRRI
jgi:outer membrane protein assembly factor BamB